MVSTARVPSSVVSARVCTCSIKERRRVAREYIGRGQEHPQHLIGLSRHDPPHGPVCLVLGRS